MKDKIIKHIPLETVSIKNKNQSAFGVKEGKSSDGKGKGSSGEGGQKPKGKEPSRDCDHCLKHHPDFPNKRHWKSNCPSIEKLVTDRFGHNISAETSDSTISSQSRISQPSGQPSGQQMRSTNNVNIGLGFHTYASFNKESYKNSVSSHKYSQILDPQSQVAIFNREDLVDNIRASDVSLTLHGMGNGSLLVNQIADHPVLGQVWFHPDASINVWQMRATEYACNVELVKKYDSSLGCKVTTAFLATNRRSGDQYRFNYDSNLYVLEEAGRQ
jgi:hypothetical protein